MHAFIAGIQLVCKGQTNSKQMLFGTHKKNLFSSTHKSIVDNLVTNAVVKI